MSDDTTVKPARTPLFVGLTAVVLLLVFLIGGYFLLNAFVLAGPAGEQQRWDRALVLFNPLVSLAFAAAGAIFGTQVQQVRVNELKNDNKNKDRKIAESLDALDDELGGGGGGGVTPEDRIARARRALTR